MSNILDERISVNAIVSVDNEELKFVSLVIDQAYGQHHHFSITLDYDIIDKAFMSNPIKHMELISKIVTIEIQQGNDNGSAYVFKGVITNVKMTGREGKHGYLILEGSSPTIMLEQGKRMDIFSNMTLKKVVTDITSSVYNDYLTCVIKPVHEGNIDFLMQYKESDWEFLQRLASLYGESFFFSGSELLFGEYDEWKTEHLMYDREIVNYQLCSKLIPNNFTNYQYLPDQDHTIEAKSSEDIEGANTFVQKALERSKDLTDKNPVYSPSDIIIGDPGELKEFVIKKKTSTAASTVVFVGEAKTCHPRIGRVYTISLPDNMTKRNELGTFRVIKVRHVIDQNHHYRNEFEAVPSKLKYMPAPELVIPKADSVLATVISNKDPQNQGRVQVDFPFSQIHHSEVWLRVMTPDAGGLVGQGDPKTGIVEVNRGIVFIPEIGDQVMIGFEFGDPNRPYVMGSMFHGKNAAGGGNNNFRKSITTRSGSTLIFSDTEDKDLYTVHLQHNDENSMSISVEKEKGTIKIQSTKDIFLTAPELIHMEAKQIVMKGEIIQSLADDKIEMIAENLIHAESSDKVEIMGSSIAEESQNEFTQQGSTFSMKASSKMDIDGGGKMNVKAGNIKMNQ